MLTWAVCLTGGHTAHAQELITFIGDQCAITLPNLHPPKTLTYSIRVLTREGWVTKGKQTLEADTSGRVHFTPDLQGLFELSTIDTASPTSLRLLAINRPARINPDALRIALPHHGQRLLEGQPVTLLAMGDSVTATGIYHQLLVMLLREATGNKQINLHVKAHPGKSVDATVRTYDSDIKPIAPHIGLLMYGLNDQGAGGAMDVYLKQTQWICQQLTTDFDTDMVLLEPTPHIESEQTAFRTRGYIQALRQLASQMNLPIAPTFDAIWGEGGKDIAQSMAKMRPFFPPHYRKQWQSLIETHDKGDTIHPNILGHLAMAQAVYNTLNSHTPALNPLQFKAQNVWSNHGMTTHLTVTNNTRLHRFGHLKVYRSDPFKSPLTDRLSYELQAGATQTYHFNWPQLHKPIDLLTLAASGFITHDQPVITITDTASEHMTVHAVETQRAGVLHYPSQRLVTHDRSFFVLLKNGHSRIIQTVTLPADQSVGTLPLITNHHGQSAVAQLSFTRFAQALTGNATVDGDLTEWSKHTWSTLGHPSQACWTRGPIDNRVSPSECHPEFTFKAANDGLYMAIRVQGNITSDRLTVFFDPRPAKKLGTAGGYYWINAGFKNGTFSASRGETSPRNIRIKSAFKQHAKKTNIELFIPYAILNQSGWPTDQDMGLSVWWNHLGVNGRTHLQWSDRGHPWNTLHYGVLRRTHSPDESLPTHVQIWP